MVFRVGRGEFAHRAPFVLTASVGQIGRGRNEQLRGVERDARRRRPQAGLPIKMTSIYDDRARSLSLRRCAQLLRLPQTLSKEIFPSRNLQNAS